MIATGNITNDDLLSLVDANLGEVEAALREASFVELASDRLIIHG